MSPPDFGSGISPELAADGLGRWAGAVAAVVDHADDPKTLSRWSVVLVVAPETLRGWCKAAGLSAKDSLDLGRVLRAVRLSAATGWRPEHFLDAGDRRTVRRLLDLSGLSASQNLPSIAMLCERQQFVTDPAAVHELRRVLRRNGHLRDDSI